MRFRFGLIAAALALHGTGALSVAALDDEQALRFAHLALDCVHRPYPNKIAHVLNTDDDARTPRELTPAFYGCFDWHSAVHGHWLLVRLAERLEDDTLGSALREAVIRNITEDHITAEADYFNAPGRVAFERPYGLAWLLQLAAELDSAGHADLKNARVALAPLEKIVVDRFVNWLPKLSHPIRTGEHSQTAFAFGLVLDYARQVGRTDLAALIEDRALTFYGDDIACPLGYEPSGQDFLSPCLAEADLMRRVMTSSAFSRWLSAFLPTLPEDGSATWLDVAVVTDKSDGKLAHLDGLNLSRAWMLRGIASGLPGDDPRRAALLSAARLHATSGLAAVTGEDYAGGHWLASFATYLMTDRGLSPD
ncbi:MAG: DUF2891 domain-containing protein [Pseudomonadota bacterium]